MEISVIVPCFRSRQTIADTLDSLRQQDFRGSYEIVVADSSDDDTSEWLSKTYPDVRVVHSQTRLLPGAARNLGANASSGEFLAFIDADARASRDWLSVLRARIDERSVVMVGAAIANANPETQPARTLYWLEFSEFLPGYPAQFRDVLSSCNLLIRRADFLAAGGFSGELGMSEDSLFSQAVGRGIFLETGTRVFHRHRTDWPTVRQHLFRLGYWSGYMRATIKMRGSDLRRVPLLSFGLTPLRLLRVIGRIRRYAQGRPSLLAEIPWLLAGLWSWNKGFYNGLRLLPEGGRRS